MTASYGFKGKKHKKESNIKRANTIRLMYKNGTAPNGMGFKSYPTEEIRRRARLSSQMKTRYGITIEDFDRMVLKQNNKCAICKKEMIKPNIDHCHKTGKVRELLCTFCNLTLGALEKFNIDNVSKLINYSQKWHTKHKNEK